MILWADVETTGLDPWFDLLLEVALVVTDDQLNEVSHITRVVQSRRLDKQKVDPFVLEMHTINGLWKDVETAEFIETVENELSGFISQHVALDQKIILAGSTVGFDRSFLKEHMPSVSSRLLYRSIDVSSIKELCIRWRPDVYDAWKRTNDGSVKPHRALPDVRQSIAELRFYRDYFFKISGFSVR